MLVPTTRTQPVFRVVLLHTEPAVQDLCPGTVCSYARVAYKIFIINSKNHIDFNFSKALSVLISNDCLFLNAGLLQDFHSNRVCCKVGAILLQDC